MTLTETLVALAIGMLMMAGAVAGYAKARDAYAVLEANARLQETARYAMALIEADVRMAGFWGLTNRAESVTATASLSFPAKCGGVAWVTDTARFIDGSNNAWLPLPNCAALSGGARPEADVLVVRRASAERIGAACRSIGADALAEVGGKGNRCGAVQRRPACTDGLEQHHSHAEHACRKHAQGDQDLEKREAFVGGAAGHGVRA